MSYTQYCLVNFGSGKTGLTTVGWQLFNTDGSANGGRVSPAKDVGGGQYAATITFPDGFQGILRWDTGGSPPVVSSVAVNPEDAELISDIGQRVDSLPTCGSGSVPVDQDTGGTDALSYKKSDGTGIDNAEINAYLTSDYTSGNMGAGFVVASTTTTAGGRWTSPLMLDPGSYTLIYFKQGQFGPDRRDILVS